MTIRDLFTERLHTPHNIDRDMWTLRRYAEQSRTVTEFGVDRGFSTVAFLSGRPRRLTSYDIRRLPEVTDIEIMAGAEGLDWRFVLGDTLEVPVIEWTDTLFLDTVHTAEQVAAELKRHGHRARRWLIFHDTITFPEILPAIEKYTKLYGWTLEMVSDVQSGLVVYGRYR